MSIQEEHWENAYNIEKKTHFGERVSLTFKHQYFEDYDNAPAGFEGYSIHDNSLNKPKSSIHSHEDTSVTDLRRILFQTYQTYNREEALTTDDLEN